MRAFSRTSPVRSRLLRREGLADTGLADTPDGDRSCGARLEVTGDCSWAPRPLKSISCRSAAGTLSVLTGVDGARGRGAAGDSDAAAAVGAVGAGLSAALPRAFAVSDADAIEAESDALELTRGRFPTTADTPAGGSPGVWGRFFGLMVVAVAAVFVARTDVDGANDDDDDDNNDDGTRVRLGGSSLAWSSALVTSSQGGMYSRTRCSSSLTEYVDEEKSLGRRFGDVTTAMLSGGHLTRTSRVPSWEMQSRSDRASGKCAGKHRMHFGPLASAWNGRLRGALSSVEARSRVHCSEPRCERPPFRYRPYSGISQGLCAGRVRGAASDGHRQ